MADGRSGAASRTPSRGAGGSPPGPRVPAPAVRDDEMHGQRTNAHRLRRRGRRRSGRQPRLAVARRLVRPHVGLVDRRAPRGAMDHRLPERRLLSAGARRPRRRRPAPRLVHPHHALASPRRPAPPGPRRRPLPRRLRAAATGRRALAARARSIASSCSKGRRGCSATGSRPPTPTTSAAAGGSRFRRRPTRPPTTRTSACAWRGWVRSRPRARAAARAIFHTYPPVEMPSADAVIGALAKPETWPDYASAIGRFTPLRAGGLAGQTFEIEVAAGTEAGRPVFQRGYVTITRAASKEDPDDLRAYVDDVNDGLARSGERARGSRGRRPGLRLRPDAPRGPLHGSRQQPACSCTSRTGARSCARRGRGRRCPGTSRAPTRCAGREAQHAFWGQGEIEQRACCTRSPSACGAG